MGFKLPTEGFKKVSEDKHKTVLQHPAGHQITIAHAPLSAKMRSQLKSLPKVDNAPKPVDEKLMADGGKVKAKPTPPGGAGSPAIDPNKAKEIQDSANESGWQPGEWKNNLQSGLGLADGGQVPDASPSIGSIIGHAVRSAVGVRDDADLSGAGNQAQAPEPTPVLAQPQQDPAFAQVQAGLEQSATPSTPTAQAQQVANDPQAAPQDPSKLVPQEPGEQIPGVSGNDQPGLEEGYKNQVQGADAQAAAVAKEGAQTAANYKAAAGQESTLLNNFTENHNAMQAEQSNMMDDIKSGQIDPNRLWNSKSGLDKAKIGIGFILSGMGSGLTGQPNMAAEMLNRSIDRDIDAQKTNLGKNENLLNAMFKQYGNMRDATDMTRVLMNSHLQHVIDESAANAAGPKAKAIAQQTKGQLQQQIAPVMYQMAMRRTLQGINQGGTGQPGSPASQGTLSHVDPATFLNIVPEGQRKEVGAELERAQNTNNMSGPILQHFDAANKALSGAGAVEGMFRTPRELNALSGLLNTTVTDLTGTARQAEFDNIQNNFIPKATDTPNDVAIKRQALQQYLQAKSSAPMAKSYGIDLNKFSSTNNTPTGHLSPQQQQFAQWAQANPGPRADMVLKKLGLK